MRKRRKNNQKEFITYKHSAFNLVHQRIAYFNNYYQFNIHRITIKNQKTRWGSCSKKGNLNFNYKIALLPQYLCDYVIVHELCHLGEFNHSQRFWKLVSWTIPHYKKIKKEFKKIPLNF
jgi:predicted metal-dependent hydrolase